MIPGSLLTMWPDGLAGLTAMMVADNHGIGRGWSPFSLDGSGRKRPREDVGLSDYVRGSNTPTLVNTRRRLHLMDSDARQKGENGRDDIEGDPPVKRFRGERNVIPVSEDTVKNANGNPQLQSALLRMIPEDVVYHCLSFLGSVEDRYALQCTCKQFRRISDSGQMLVNIQVVGDRETGKNGIIQEVDTPETAAVALSPFSRAGNLEAIYMLGIIKSYCHQDVERGIFLLKTASSNGYVRSSYALGLVLRDSKPEDATAYMRLAAVKGYLPALQELLPAREMKAKYGEPNADELRRHLDPICLNLLLGRHYVQSAELRELNTSHCWNPLCGRWAFKASFNANGAELRIRRPRRLAFIGNGGTQPVGIAGNFLPMAEDGSRARPSDGDTRVDSSGVSYVPSQHQPRTDQIAVAPTAAPVDIRVSRMKMCSRCCRAKYCSKLCQVYDWRSGRHKMECQYL